MTVNVGKIKSKLLSVLHVTPMAQCGHQTKITNTIHSFGKKREVTLLVGTHGIPYCHQCLREMASQCPHCKQPIFVGEKIGVRTLPSTEISISVDNQPEQQIILCFYCCFGDNHNNEQLWIQHGALYLKAPERRKTERTPHLFHQQLRS